MSVKVTRKVTTVGHNFYKFMEEAEKNNKVVRVGWFKGNYYENNGKTVPVAYIATIQEFGDASKNIPPRSFMRSTISEKNNEWVSFTRALIKNAINKGLSVDYVLDSRGQLMEGAIREKITQITSPPLKPATIKARIRAKSDKKTQGLLDKPLVHTKKMLNTLTSRVEKK